MALKFRRGTTAQKSGSLAVGEPYINYDLQTLQIGTDQGDVTLSTTSPTATSAVASVSASNFVSASYLHIVNDANIKGNVTIGGTIQIGDQTSDVVNVVASLSSSLIPETDNTFDLGSLNKAWRDIYVSTGSIKMVSNGVVVSTLSNTANGFTLDQGIVARGDSSFGTSSLAVTSITGSLRVSGSLVNGTGVNAYGAISHAEGNLSKASGFASHAEGIDTHAYGEYSHAEGFSTIASGAYSHVEGNDSQTRFTASGSHAEGYSTYIEARYAHAEGNNSNVLTGGDYGHAEGDQTNVYGYSGHSEGRLTNVYATGIAGHAEGNYSSVSGPYAHAEGNYTIAQGSGSHAEGSSSWAYGHYSHAEGIGTKAYAEGQLAAGKFNLDNNTTSLFVIGNGSDDNNRSDVFRIETDGIQITGSLKVNGVNFETFSTSVDSRLDAVESFSSSLGSTFATDAELSSLSASVAAVGYAVKGTANTFTGNQTVTGSVYVSGDLIVQGSSSLQNITASAVSIGTNTVILNTDSPAVRFAGIKVIDSGSSSATGSLLWDSQNNVWLYQNPDGLGYNSAILISGPKNSGSLGNEVALTTNKIPKIQGTDHLIDSIMSEVSGTIFVEGAVSASTITGIGNVTAYSTSVDSRIITNANAAAGAFSSASAYSSSFATTIGNLGSTYATDAELSSVSGAFAANTITINGTAVKLGGTLTTAQTLAGAISTSAQVDHNSTTNYVANKHIDHTAVSITAGSGISGGGDISATRTITLDTASAHFVSGARAGLSVADTTGASGIDLTYNAGLGTLSGVLANSSVTINGTSLSLGGTLTTAQTLAGAISSSAQVDLTATTNYGTYINQAVKTTSSPTFAGLTINGSITATGDITAYYTSDRRFKDNVQTIPNALDKVKALNGVTWDWAENTNDVTKAAPTTGLIAQEVQAVLPQVVKEKEDGFLGLDYSKMIGLLVEAIKEQQYKIDLLSAELEGLKTKD